MIERDTQKQAERLLDRMFNIGESRLSSKHIQKRLGINPPTYYNYSKILRDTDFVTSEPSQTGSGLVDLVLTDKGRKFLIELKKSTIPISYVKSDTPVEDITTLDGVTVIVDRFNAQSKEWKWELVRKGAIATQ